jgi:hypothetical protein
MDILAGMSGLKTGIDLLRSLRDALKSGHLAPDEVAGRIAEIYDFIVDSKDALVDAKDEIQALKDKIRSLEDTADLHKRVRFHDQAVWKAGDKDFEEGPFCPVCWSLNSKLVRPTIWDSRAEDSIAFMCQVHDKHVGFSVPRRVCREHSR